MNNIYVLNKNYKQIGVLSNQGANPQAPYYEDLFIQELETGADTYQFSTMSTPYTQDLLEIGNHIMFTYKNRNELFTITSLEYSHNEGYKTIGVYAEGIGFDLLEVYMKRPENEKENSSGGSSSSGSSSGSGGSSSGGGRDEDNDGDDNTDDEYADVDDVYVDENGIIIYDKYGQDDYADPDNVSVDENGVIIYRRNKRNRKKDSLEFKNISYSRFLSILLKNTGWSYVCQPGLESIKHDITVRYDTNIFALLQDSIQSYRGVELEFVHELVGGRVQKVIKAYKDGGRGSFVGKRFEYGVNVKGITKNQEVANSQDDTVLYVDNVGIAVSYDVDFALKSAEIPEIEIGDTHYVIDNDFYPPMTIKARIGKIEISFSDPTVNKIYLANNKKISGSAVEDELDEDDIAGIMDDYEYGNDGAAYDHYHDRLISKYEKTYVSDDGKTKVTATRQTSVELSDYKLLPGKPDAYHLGDKYTHWDFAYTNNIRNVDDVTSPRYFGYNYHVRYDREDMKDVKKIGNSGDITKQDLLNFIINDLNIYEYGSIEVYEVSNKDVDDPNAYFDKKYLGILSEDVYGSNGKISEVGKKVQAPVVAGDTNNDGDQNADDYGEYHVYNIPALLSCLIGAFQYHVSGGEPTGPTNKDQDDDYDGGGGVNPGGGSDPGDDTDPDNPSTGTITSTFDVAEGNKLIANTVEATLFDGYQADLNILTVGDYIQLPDGTKIYGKEDLGEGGESTPSNPNTGSYPNIFDPDASPEDIYVGYVEAVGFNAVEGHIGALSTTQIFGWNKSTSDTIEIYGDVEVIGNITAKNISGGSASGNTFDTITVRKIQGPDPGEGQYNRVDFEDGIGVTHIFCNSEDENGVIFIGDHLALHAGMTIFDDIELEEGCGIVFPDGSKLTSANGLSGGNSSTGDITANKITIGTPTDSKVSRCTLAVKGNTLVEGNLYIEGDNGLYVNGTPGSDKSLKENIRYVDNTGTIIVDKENLETRDYYNEDLLEKTDLHDFIVNQVNICEYNFIGKDRTKIGFIANEYEGTKVGDKIVSRDKELDLLFYDSDNLLFATIGALQEEVRIKDEQIATLEDRLARLEALLGINN